MGTISASIHEEKDSIEEIIEPYLIQIGFLDRTPRGRMATRLAYEHYGLTPSATPQARPVRFSVKNLLRCCLNLSRHSRVSEANAKAFVILASHFRRPKRWTLAFNYQPLAASVSRERSVYFRCGDELLRPDGSFSRRCF